MLKLDKVLLNAKVSVYLSIYYPPDIQDLRPCDGTQRLVFLALIFSKPKCSTRINVCHHAQNSYV